ncbi:MAG: RidA family protein [Clostridia bacterium]|nr:RidA family protein [Clostridia bacterium]
MKQTINAQNAPKALGPYSHAVKTDSMVFTSGQIGIDPETGKLCEGIEAQTVQVLKNLEAVLTAAGTSIANVIKTTVFVADLKDFATVNKLYGEVFTENAPARSCVEVAALPASALVEIEAIAVIDAD